MEIQTFIKPVPDGGAWSPESAEDREAIREQLGRLLGSTVFKRSKGCSNLLAYVVNRTLDGDAEHLKERSIGIEVFGRAPDYDTASDHVVRSAAGDVRKRLAQYYLQPGHSSELRIEIPPGSYIPRFIVYPAAPPQEPEETAAGPVSIRGRRRIFGFTAGRQRWMAALTIGGAAILTILVLILTMTPASGSALYRFWQPILQSPNPVLLCIGAWNQPNSASRPAGSQPSASGDAPPESAGAFRGSEKVYLDDAMSLLKLAGWLQQNDKPFSILPGGRVAFADLQAAPAILIGFNNYWTTSFASRFRFTMERERGSDIVVLRDRKNPSRNNWSVNLATPYNQPTTDYALVVRALNPQTGQMVIAAAGLTHFGTLAAGEFLTDPAQMKKLDAVLPKGWHHRNLAVVLSTDVIKGSPGSPRVIATDLW